MVWNTYSYNIQHHVVVVDQEYELFLSGRELSRHSQDEILHLGLEPCEHTVDTFVGKRFVETDEGAGELCIPTSDLR